MSRSKRPVAAGGVGILLAAVALVGCGGGSPDTADDAASATSLSAEQRDERLAEQPSPSHSPQPADPMNLEPRNAAPGADVALTFPRHTSRGVNFLLQSPSSSGDWRDVAYLFTDANGVNGQREVPGGGQRKSPPRRVMG